MYVVFSAYIVNSYVVHSGYLLMTQKAFFKAHVSIR